MWAASGWAPPNPARPSTPQPANGEVLAALPDVGREEMRRAIDAAARAQEEWGETTARHRAGIMREAARLMHDRQEHLARVMTLEQGKPIAESRGEIVYAASFIEWFAEEARRVYGQTVPASFPDKRILVISDAKATTRGSRNTWIPSTSL